MRAGGGHEATSAAREMREEAKEKPTGSQRPKTRTQAKEIRQSRSNSRSRRQGGQMREEVMLEDDEVSQELWDLMEGAA